MHATRAAALLILTLAAAPGQPSSAQRFRVDVDAVRVDALVTRSGRPLGGLKASDFELLDNAVRQHVDALSVEVVPVNVLLTLDLSESVAGERLRSLLRAGRALIDELRPIDRAAIVTFSHEITERVELTDGRKRLLDALSGPRGDGSTSLYDATYAALLLRPTDQSRTLLLVFSDGHDTSSWLNPSDVVEAAARSDVVAYAIATGPVHAPQPVDRLMRQPHGRSGTGTLRPRPGSNDFLARLTETTGGRLLHAEARHLGRSFADLLKEFHNRYLLTYVPRGVETHGWHEITLRVKRTGARVHARRGYWRQ